MSSARIRGGRPSIRVRALALPLFAFALLPLVAQAAQAGPVLPTGGSVASGAATISGSGASLTISQTSAKAIIDWSGFSIGQGGTVRFANGSGATLNRVGGAGASAIDGALTATGSVYLINPSGVIVGKSGVVNTGGSFVASTLDVADAAFLAGGDLTFTGTSTAGVVNLGKIASLGGDVVLVGGTVSNAGAITAANGTAGLVAGLSVLIRDEALDGGKFAVLVGGSATSATNSGTLQAANAELRAEGGNVYALAGDTGGVIRATGVKAADGKVWLVAEGGTATVAGAIIARGANGAGGFVETSGAQVTFAGVRVDTRGAGGKAGTWLIDPTDLTIDASAAAAIASNLATSNVTLQTNADGTTSGPGNASSGPGDIIVNSAITWSSANTLSLLAYHDIAVNAAITGTNGVLTLTPGGGAANAGTVSATGAIDVKTFDLTNGAWTQNSATLPGFTAADFRFDPANASFLRVTGGSGTAGSPYVIADAYGLQGLASSTLLTQSFILAGNIDASGTAGWNAGTGFLPIGVDASGNVLNGGAGFTGALDGKTHQVTGLVIDRPSGNDVGLFGMLGAGGSLTNVGVASGSVTGGTAVGGLVGLSAGTIAHAYASDSASGTGDVGGLVGVNTAGLSDVYATGTVTSTGADAGGLVGRNADGAGYGSASITQSYASGTVNGADDTGGLVGFANSGVFSQVYATGAVSGGRDVGGLLGFFAGILSQDYASGAVTAMQNGGALLGYNNGASISTSYWDKTTSGLSVGFGVGHENQATGLTSTQFMNPANFHGFTFTTTPGASGWVIVDKDGSLNRANGANGATRPILASEYATTIASAHQLELMAMNLAAAYTLAGNVDASGTANASDVWGGAAAGGFVPVGLVPGAGFTGSLDGAGYAITGLTINRPAQGRVGLFGTIAMGASVSNLALLKVSITGAQHVGAIAGDNSGTLTDDFVGGTVSGTQSVGGLVGENDGGVTGSSSAAAVSGGRYVGGLVGRNAAGATIASSSASGSATSTGDYAGGLVGLNDGGVSGSSADAVVSGAEDTGGLIGYSTGSVTGDHVTGGSVMGTDRVGGLIGRNTGAVSGDSASVNVSGTDFVGGLIGYNTNANVSTSTASGTVTATGKHKGPKYGRSGGAH